MAGLKRGVEIERKFIIKMPDLSLLKGQEGYIGYEIEQIYLEGSSGVTHRIRARRATAGDTVYFETVKTRIDKMSVIEDEGEITRERYEELRLKMDPSTRPIHKCRHAFSWNDETVEVDIYPDWQRSAILEIELPSRECDYTIPPFIEVVCEVTGDGRYSNASMSHSFPPEVI